MSLGIRRELPKTRTKAVRLLHGCKRCKHFRTEQVTKRTKFYYGSYGRLESKVEYLTVEGAFRPHVEHLCPAGHVMGFVEVVGRYSEKHVCGARCLNATGPSCECSCKGENHGGGHGSV